MEHYVKEAARRKAYEEREERMIDYVVAGLTVDQVLAAEKAYKNRFNTMFPNGFIGYIAPVETPDECGKGEDEKKAETSVKEKFEDLLISE
ncbi:hypothetical protein MKW94_025503 [Papaver nudicaule]|uniref:Uncharacterized protein n=1 Tax=Papaver nudicaule TaxID=74823 RepID=A0AA41SHD3_PAPNU|nr:hypothetical protein [Papaver nudicaule]